MPHTPASLRWGALVEAHARSGLTTRAFADREDVNPRTLAWWRWRLRRANPTTAAAVVTTAFTEVTVEAPVTRRSVVLAFDALPVHVVVDPHTDLALLRQLVRALA